MLKLKMAKIIMVEEPKTMVEYLKTEQRTFVSPLYRRLYPISYFATSNKNKNTLMEETKPTTQTATQSEEHTLTGRLEAMLERETAIQQLLGVLDATLNRFRYEELPETFPKTPEGQSIVADSIFNKCDCIVYNQIGNESIIQSIIERLNKYL